MESHICKICSRNFANGRALGGHMRSHMMNFCISKNKKKLQEFDQLHHQSIHSCSSSDFLDDPEFSVVLQDGESEAEAESSRNNVNPFGRRSKRARNGKTQVFSSKMVGKFSKNSSMFGETNEEQSSPLSSAVSDTTTEEDVAHCLMMLSRDKWEREKDEWERESNEDDEDDDEEDSGHVVKMKNNVKKIRGKYRCETCNKVFKSYQALGGHRASYKKMKSDVAARNGGGGPVVETVAAAEVKVHECPFCHRVFASGQALGGHKRSHFMGASNVSSLKRVLKSVENLDIDLNLPAPIDEDDDQFGH